MADRWSGDVYGAGQCYVAPGHWHSAVLGVRHADDPGQPRLAADRQHDRMERNPAPHLHVPRGRWGASRATATSTGAHGHPQARTDWARTLQGFSHRQGSGPDTGSSVRLRFLPARGREDLTFPITSMQAPAPSDATARQWGWTTWLASTRLNVVEPPDAFLVTPSAERRPMFREAIHTLMRQIEQHGGRRHCWFMVLAMGEVRSEKISP